MLTYYVSYLFNRRLRILFIMTTRSFHPKYIINWHRNNTSKSTTVDSGTVTKVVQGSDQE